MLPVIFRTEYLDGRFKVKCIFNFSYCILDVSARQVFALRVRTFETGHVMSVSIFLHECIVLRALPKCFEQCKITCQRFKIERVRIQGVT